MSKSTELKDYWSDPEPEDPKTTRKVAYVAKDIDDRSGEQKINERIKSYENDLDASSLTESDRSQIKNLARLEVGIEAFTEKLSNIGESDSKTAKSLSDTLSTLMAQHRQIASALGIDRKSRSSRGESEYEEYLPRLHKQAYNFMAEKSIVIMCPVCINNKAHTKINEGFIVFHFREDVDWEWRSACPSCKQQFVINYGNWQNFTRAAINKIGKLDGKTEDDSTEEFDA